MAVDKRIEACRKLGMSEAEIREMLEEDKRIDRGEVMDWDLPPEEHKKAMKYANSDEKKRKKPENSGEIAYNFDNSGKKCKENPTKEGIITKIFDFLCGLSEFSIENVEILNKERKILFRIGEDWYSFTLTKHRTKPDK